MVFEARVPLAHEEAHVALHVVDASPWESSVSCPVGGCKDGDDEEDDRIHVGVEEGVQVGLFLAWVEVHLVLELQAACP